MKPTSLYWLIPVVSLIVSGCDSDQTVTASQQKEVDNFLAEQNTKDNSSESNLADSGSELILNNSNSGNSSKESSSSNSGSGANSGDSSTVSDSDNTGSESNSEDSSAETGSDNTGTVSNSEDSSAETGSDNTGSESNSGDSSSNGTASIELPNGSILGGENTALTVSTSGFDSNSTLTYNWQTNSSLISLNNANSSTIPITANAVSKQSTATITVTVSGTVNGQTTLETTSATITIKARDFLAYGTGKLADTGQTYSDPYYSTPCNKDATEVLDCATGLDVIEYDLSDGHAGLQYQKLSGANRAELSSYASDWDCVLDKVTGLYWEAKNKDSTSLHYYLNKVSWYSTDPLQNSGRDTWGTRGTNSTSSICNFYAAPSTFCNTDTFINKVNDEKLCGFDDWRLPTITELLSIVNFDIDRDSRKVDQNYFPNVLTGTSVYWSSTIRPSSATSSTPYIYYIYLSDADIKNTYRASDWKYARLVRGGLLNAN